MTEVLYTATPVVEAYYDNIGNLLVGEEIFDHEIQEADRYLRDLGKKKAYPKLPRSILGLIAAYGQPGLADSYIRYTTWYVHRDNEVLDQMMSGFAQIELVDQTIANKDMALNTLERPGDRYYSLTSKAYENIPVLELVVDAKQGLAKNGQLPKSVLAYLEDKHKLDVTTSQT